MKDNPIEVMPRSLERVLQAWCKKWIQDKASWRLAKTEGQVLGLNDKKNREGAGWERLPPLPVSSLITDLDIAADAA